MGVAAYESTVLGFSFDGVGGSPSPLDVSRVEGSSSRGAAGGVSEAGPEPAGVQEAFQVLNYNQQLIQFADSKAGNLIVINSLFIAAAQSQGLQAGLSVGHLVQTGYVLLSCLAVLACLRAISSRGFSPASDRKDFIFYNDILSRNNASRYIRDFKAADSDFQMDSTLRRTFVLAQIAQSKFEVYSLAQKLTIWAAITWVSSHLLSVLAW